MIYHLTTPVEWTFAQQQGTYSAPSLDTEGYIHCSGRDQIEKVANSFYKHEDTLLVIRIDETKLTSLVKWEAPAHPDDSHLPSDMDEQLFPHVYGVINMDAVDGYWSMPKDDDGYHLPEEA